MLNEHMVVLLPAAVYALSVGCAPFVKCFRGLSLFNASEDVNGAMNDWVKVFVDISLYQRAMQGSGVLIPEET